VKEPNPRQFRPALGLQSRQTPAPGLKGWAGEQKLFWAPPLKGWILVFGSGLPEPVDDVDICFVLSLI